nr:ABC transporter permease subunit [Halovenus carboxidivorans]
MLRIARWEVQKNAGGLDRRTVAITVAVIVLFGAVSPLIASGGAGLEEDIYRVSVDEDSQYYGVAADDPKFRIVDGGEQALRDGEIELLIDGSAIRIADTRKGSAAFSEFRDSIQAYNNEQLAMESNQTAAFPIQVTVEFREQSAPGRDNGSSTGGETTDGSDGTDGGTTDGSDGSDGDGTDSGTGDGTDGGTSGGTDGGDGTSDGSAVGSATPPLGDDEISGSPADINPPFPFQSLVLAFVFVIPLNFLIQAYGSTMLSERLNRRGELLLVSPVSRLDIIGGKTLPYFAGAIAVEGVIAAALYYIAQGGFGGAISLFAITPIVLLFLSATFLGAMFARSFKELTFITVTITVVLTSYAFVPAIFTDSGPVALISPLTLVVRELQGEALSLSAVAFSTLPPFLTAGLFFGLGSGLYREEDLFDQRSITGKVLDALAVPISRPYHVGIMTIVLIPFVFVSQLLAIALVFPIARGSPEIGQVLILIVVAVVEEFAKSLHIYAAHSHNTFERTRRVAVVLGIASGIGFFLGEKIALLGQLVGLSELDLARQALQGGNVPEGPVVVLFLFAPLALHVVTATISSVGALGKRRRYLAAVAAAIVVHLVYNLTVVNVVA